MRGFARTGAGLADLQVGDLMTRVVMTCGADDSMAEAESRMIRQKIRHLPVVNRGRLLGMLSIRDVTTWRLQETRKEADVLREAVIAARR